MSIGLDLLASIVKSGDLNKFISLGLSDDLFLPSEKDVFAAVEGHIKKYGVVPHFSTVGEYVPDLPLPELVPEPPDFYFEKVRNRYTTNSLRAAMLKTKDLLVAGSITEAVNLIVGTATAISVKINEASIVDFRKSMKLICNEYVKQVKGENTGVPFGWSYLDDLSSGMQPGDFISIVGRPQQGKTQCLLKIGHSAWKRNNVSTLLVSMEMKPLPMMQRLANLDQKINLSHLKKGELTTKKYNELKKGLLQLENHDVPFWVIDGNLTTRIDDVWALCLQLKPGLVLVDGAYLMQTDNPRDSRWEKMAKSAEGLKKDIASNLGIPAAATYQFSKDSSKKKKKGEKPGLEDIYGSDTVAQLSSVALGILEEDSAENINTKTVTVLKGRNGEMGEFKINFNYQLGDFSQFVEENLYSLQFV